MVDDSRVTVTPRSGSADPAVPVGSLTTLAPGTRVGKYEIVDVLGQGGFGITYLARDTQLKRDVAVKEYLPAHFAERQTNLMVLPRSTRTADDFLWGRERFLAEATTLAQFTDAPGIVNVFDFLEANGTAYMVMALVRGETLEARLKRDQRLPQPAVEQMLYPMLDGLERIHAAGFLHRDIKPANILLDPQGQPTLIDFGASRVALQGRTQAMTAVFTLSYAAFEQVTSAKQGPWTDIYALSATLYHCISGAPPLSALDRVMEDRLVPASDVGKGRYGPSLLAAIDAGLAVKAGERPQSIADWRSVLSGVPPRGVSHHQPQGPATRRMDVPVTASPEPAVPKRRAPLMWIAAGVVALTLGGGGAWLALRPPAETVDDVRRRTEAEAQRQADATRLRQQEEVRRQQEEARAEAERRAAEQAKAEAARREAEQRAAAEAAQRRAEEAEARRKAEEDARARAEAETAQRQATEAEARRKAEADARAQADAEAAQRRAQEAETRRQAEADARARADAEATQRRAQEAEAAARRQAEETAAQARAAEEAARQEAAARRKAEADARARADADARRQAEEAEEEARRAADEKARAEADTRRQAEAGEAALRLSEVDRRRIQVALTALGFDTQGSDGVLGARTRQMVAAWQKRNGAPETGYLSASQVAMLQQQAAAALKRYDDDQKRIEDDKRKGDEDARRRQEEEARRKTEDDARRRAEEERRRQQQPATPPAASATGDLFAGWASFQGCLTSSGGSIGSDGYRSAIVGRKVCFSSASSGRYEVTLDNGMVCSAFARKSASPVGFSVDRQTCTAPKSGNPTFTRIQPFTASCERRAATSLSCRTAFERGSTAGPFTFTAQ